MKLTWILLGVLIVGISIYLAIFLFFSFMSPLDKIESELLQKDGEVYVWIDLSFPSNPITLAKLEERGLEIRYNRYGSLTISGKTDVSKLLDIASVPEVVYIREVENYYFDVFDVSRASCYHDIDYERLWNTLNRTDMKILIGMTFSSSSPLSEDFSRRYDPGPVSTVYSSLKRMMQEGFVVKTEEGYGIDDPFFRRWIWRQRTR